MDWLRNGANWPNHEHSRFVICDETRWHLQQSGTGPQVLLLHGSGATTHSYADMFGLLARDHSVTAIDLPGQGFTSRLGGGAPTLERVASAVAKLLAKENINPHLIIGHSAGAAIAVQMVTDGLVAPDVLVSINGAFYPFSGLSGSILPMAAKLLFLNPFVPWLVAKSAGNTLRVERLIESTGSTISRESMTCYQKAIASSDHVEGTLAMMAHWELEPMAGRLAALELPVLQIVGLTDGTVPPSAARKTANILKHGSLVEFPGKGHLVHEEDPQAVVEAIRAFVNAVPVE